jgi:hypothetical protein
MVSVLALGAFATGCDDDKKESTADAGGGKDAGPVVDAAVDAGETPVPGKQCGDMFCPKTKALLGQCCVDDGDVCGIDLKPPTPGAESIGCFPADAPGVKSDHCGVVLDMFETDGKVEGKFEIAAGATNITVPPCCTPAGTCGVDGNMSSAGLLGTGCLDALALQPAPSGDAGGGFELPFEANGLPILPNTFCDPKTGEAGCIPSEFMGNKVPPFLLGACPTAVKDGCIERVEQNIRGCGEDKKWDRKSVSALCIDNIAADKWGCDDISAETLARIPEIACGCGEGEAGTGRCIPNVAADTCGTSEITATPTAKECASKTPPLLCGFDEFLCGCGNGKIAGPRDVCLSNVDTALCGVIPVAAEPTCKGGADAGSDPLLCNLPSVLCGCGDEVRAADFPAAPAPCLDNVPTDICGQTVGCTGVGVNDGSDSCKGPESCADVAPFAAEVKDGVGDACGCNPALNHDGDPDTAPVDTCQLFSGGATFTCTNVAPSGQPIYRCSCGTVGMQGTCGDGKICTDTDTPANMLGDTCM